MAKELTERQKHVLQAIQEWITTHGYPPTIRELGKHIGIKSLRGVTTHLEAIAKKGFLTRHRAARGIKLHVESVPTRIEHALRVPIIGRIAAGQPIFAEEHVEGQLTIDAALVGSGPGAAAESQQHFALKVHGESMVNAGILDGDYVIVRQQSTADNGDIVVALIGDEATVKRFFLDHDHIRLQPAHPTMEPIILSKEQEVTVLGKVIALFRTIQP